MVQGELQDVSSVQYLVRAHFLSNVKALEWQGEQLLGLKGLSAGSVPDAVVVSIQLTAAQTPNPHTPHQWYR